jgi:hypothetical protein
MAWMLSNLPLMVLFFALWVGIPTWLVLRRPDAKPTPAAAPAVRTLTPRRAWGEDDADRRRVA